MSKSLRLVAVTGLGALMVVSAVAPLAATVSVNADSNTSLVTKDAKKLNQLNILEESGFQDDWSGEFNQKTFDDSTNEIVYRSMITFTTPSGNDYEYKNLVGHTKDGNSETLATMHEVEQDFEHGLEVKYQLSDSEKQKFSYYTIEVRYYSPIEPQYKYDASAAFTL